MTTPATILVQSDDPSKVEGLTGDLSILGRAVHLVGPYDVLLEVECPNPDALARLVIQIQQVDHVARTLTLPHVTEEPKP